MSRQAEKGSEPFVFSLPGSFLKRIRKNWIFLKKSLTKLPLSAIIIFVAERQTTETKKLQKSLKSSEKNLDKTKLT